MLWQAQITAIHFDSIFFLYTKPADCCQPAAGEIREGHTHLIKLGSYYLIGMLGIGKEVSVFHPLSLQWWKLSCV